MRSRCSWMRAARVTHATVVSARSSGSQPGGRGRPLVLGRPAYLRRFVGIDHTYRGRADEARRTRSVPEHVGGRGAGARSGAAGARRAPRGRGTVPRVRRWDPQEGGTSPRMRGRRRGCTGCFRGFIEGFCAYTKGLCGCAKGGGCAAEGRRAVLWAHGHSEVPVWRTYDMCCGELASRLLPSVGDLPARDSVKGDLPSMQSLQEPVHQLARLFVIHTSTLAQPREGYQRAG